MNVPIKEDVTEKIFLMEHARKVTKKKEFIIKDNQNQHPKGMLYILLSGEALLEEKSLAGESFFYLIAEKQMFGIEHLLPDEKKSNLEYTVTALTDVYYLEIEAQLFLDHVYLNPKLYHSLLSDIISRYFLLAKSYQYVNQKPEVKVGNSLFNIAKILDLKQTKSGKIVFPSYITQSFLSKYIKSSEANVSNACLYLEKEKILSRKPFIIMNQQKLSNIIFTNSKKERLERK